MSDQRQQSVLGRERVALAAAIFGMIEPAFLVGSIVGVGLAGSALRRGSQRRLTAVAALVLGVAGIVYGIIVLSVLFSLGWLRYIGM